MESKFSKELYINYLKEVLVRLKEDYEKENTDFWRGYLEGQIDQVMFDLRYWGEVE